MRMVMLIFVLFAFTFACASFASENVLIIDLGHLTKAAVYDPQTKTYEILTNRESARKSPLCVAIKKSGIEAEYGTVAKTLASKKDVAVFCDLNIILGRSLTEDIAQVSFYKQLNPRNVLEPTKDRNFGISLAMQSDNTPSFLVEELLALFFLHLRSLANNTSECVVAIPPYFTPVARQAVLDAAELAGLKVNELIHDITAAALHHALTVVFDLNSLIPGADMLETQVIFMDIGHTHTSTALISYQRNGAPPARQATRVTNLATHSRFGVGGGLIDIAIRDYFLDIFKKEVDLENATAEEMSEISHVFLQEASNAKFKLTVTSSVTIAIDSLYRTHSFRLIFTRSDFETVIGHLIPKFIEPLEEILNTQHTASTLMLIGGTSRVPFIQSAINSTLERFNSTIKIGHSINAEEGPVMGAALKALLNDIKFNRNTIKLFERPTTEINIVKDNDPNTNDGEPIFLWNSTSKTNFLTMTKDSPLMKKILVYKLQPFSLSLYASGHKLASIEVGDLDNITSTFRSLSEMPLSLENSTRSDKSFISTGFSLPVSGPSNGIPYVSHCEAVQRFVTLNNSTNTNTPNSTISLPLKYTYRLNYPPLGRDHRKAILARLQAIERFSLLTRAHNSARNTLESNIFSLRPILTDWIDTGYKPPKEFFSEKDILYYTNADTLKSLKTLLDQLNDKLDYGGYDDVLPNADESAIMEAQIAQFEADNGQIEVMLADAKHALAEYIAKKKAEEEALRKKLAEEAKAREEEERRKQEEATAELLRQFQEQLKNLTNITSTDTAPLNTTMEININKTYVNDTIEAVGPDSRGMEDDQQIAAEADFFVSHNVTSFEPNEVGDGSPKKDLPPEPLFVEHEEL